jgi:DNA-binding winged helix-turn-helix (wHTH) protein
MQPVDNRTFRFEGFTLDLRCGSLCGADGEISLRPKSFEVLRYLIENAGRLVRKDEIIRAVWPNVVVTDESLTRCVSDVRLALHDHGQRIIRTAPRRGYLLAASVSASAADAESAQHAATSAPTVTPSTSQMRAEAPSNFGAQHGNTATSNRRNEPPWARRPIWQSDCKRKPRRAP